MQTHENLLPDDIKDYGYRTETYSGSGIRNAEDVVLFEIIELCNTDILDTLLHNTPFIKDTYLRHEMTGIIDYLDSINNDDGKPYDDDHMAFVMEATVKRMLDEVRKNSGYHIKYALWLARYDIVTNKNPDENGYGMYLTDDTEIDKYKTGPVVLSYLGDGGVLFGYEEMPHPVNNE